MQRLTLNNKTKVVYGQRGVELRVELTMLSFSLASDAMYDAVKHNIKENRPSP